jgi:hypothetical protein
VQKRDNLKKKLYKKYMYLKLKFTSEELKISGSKKLRRAKYMKEYFIRYCTVFILFYIF